MLHLVTRTLKFTVRSESYRWLNAAAIEVNQVLNHCNETSYLAAIRTHRKRLSGFDLVNLTLWRDRIFRAHCDLYWVRARQDTKRRRAA